MAGRRPRQGLAQGRQLRVAADKAGEPRATAAWRRCRSALVPTRSKTSTGAVSPLTGTGPSALTRIKPSTRRSVAAVRRIVPGGASCSMRARWVVSPMAE